MPKAWYRKLVDILTSRLGVSGHNSNWSQWIPFFNPGARFRRMNLKCLFPHAGTGGPNPCHHTEETDMLGRTPVLVAAMQPPPVPDTVPASCPPTDSRPNSGRS